MSVYETEYISNEICEKIINEYSKKVKLVEHPGLRRQKNFHEQDENSWLFKYINKFIKNNLGDGYSLLRRVTVLRYDVGDYFNEHTDGPSNKKLSPDIPFHFYGGVEISNKSEFEGGEFLIKGNKVDFKKGRLFTHDFLDLHGVNVVTKGIRWSIHFPILNSDFKKIL